MANKNPMESINNPERLKAWFKAYQLVLIFAVVN